MPLESSLINTEAVAVAGLSGFGLTQERAQELYAESERDTYSQELYSILAAAGLG